MQRKKRNFASIFLTINATIYFVRFLIFSFKLRNWPQCDNNAIIINIPMHYNDKHVGYYSIEYDLNGEIFDDWFVCR